MGPEIQYSNTPVLQHPNISDSLISDFCRLQIHIRSDPAVRRRGVALASGVLGEKYIAGIESYAAAVADADIDTAGQRDYPAAMRRAIVVDDMRREIISKQQTVRGASFVEELRCSARVQRLEMRLPVVACVESVELHQFPPGGRDPRSSHK